MFFAHFYDKIRYIDTFLLQKTVSYTQDKGLAHFKKPYPSYIYT